MSSTMATTATTCDTVHNLHGAIGLARSHRHAASFSSANTYSTDDFPALTKEDLPARDSLEIARKTIAHKHARRDLAVADGDDLPVLTPEDLPARDSLEFVRKTIAHKRERRNAALPADVINADDTTFGYPLTRMGRRIANGPWDHYVTHKDSLDLSRERATIDTVAKRRSLKQRVCTRVRTTVNGMGATLARTKSASSLKGSASEQDISVESRPRIEVMQHTMRKLT